MPPQLLHPDTESVLPFLSPLLSQLSVAPYSHIPGSSQYHLRLLPVHEDVVPESVSRHMFLHTQPVLSVPLFHKLPASHSGLLWSDIFQEKVHLLLSALLLSE